jgi:Anti-sigma factor NepR
MSDTDESKPAPAFGPAVMRAIGRELRAMYAEIIAEGVPERFAESLRRFDDPNNEGETR